MVKLILFQLILLMNKIILRHNENACLTLLMVSFTRGTGNRGSELWKL